MTDEKVEPVKTITENKTFGAMPVKVDELLADLEIQVNDKESIDIEITGPEKSVKSVIVSEKDGYLKITGGSNDGFNISAMNIGPKGKVTLVQIANVSGLGSVNIIGNNNVVDSGVIVGINIPKTKVLVKMPKGTPLSVIDVDGKTIIGDTDGPLTLKVSSMKKAKVGSVINADLSTASMGGIEISKVTGTLVAEVGSQGNINILDGQVSDLKVDLSSMGHFDFGGTALNADLESDGHTHINSVNGTLTIVNESMGSVEVDGGEVTMLKVRNHSMGKVKFGGKAVDAELRNSDMGKIKVAYVKNTPYMKNGSMGKITVSNWD